MRRLTVARVSALAIPLLVAVTAGVVLWPVTPVSAQQGSATANMQVSANVIRKCTITALPLDFGTYDPVQNNSSAPLEGQSTLIVACTKGTSVNIGLDNGTNAQGATRRMTAGGTNLLTYELFKDGGRSQRWGDTGGERFDGGVAPSRDPRQFIVYGRIAGGQDVAEGNFQDTVLVTVQF
jgi:spore coat protein U-like protein